MDPINGKMSIEQVFGQFDKDGDGKINAKEAKESKNSIFSGNIDFAVEEGMTLDAFEAANLKAYQEYEEQGMSKYDKANNRFEKAYDKHNAILDEQRNEYAAKLTNKKIDLMQQQEERENRLRGEFEAMEDIKPDENGNSLSGFDFGATAD